MGTPMTALLSPRIWIALAFAALLAVIGGQQLRISNAYAVSAGLRTDIAQTKAAYADAARIAQADADRLAAVRLTQQIEASNAAKLREKSLLADAAGSRDALDRLRVAIRATAARGDPVPGVPAGAGSVDGSAIGELLAQCAAQLVSVAAIADGAVTDVQTLRESWPK